MSCILGAIWDGGDRPRNLREAIEKPAMTFTDAAQLLLGDLKILGLLGMGDPMADLHGLLHFFPAVIREERGRLEIPAFCGGPDHERTIVQEGDSVRLRLDLPLTIGLVR